ncbi:hypothetical protein M8J77_013657 [Diaphorina citri]|nr:hypothetical protein M8J77_013657 [Diaphorina citri]
MVLLNADLIIKWSSNIPTTKPKPDRPPEETTKKLSHLYLNDKRISNIHADVAQFINVSTVYLHNNLLTSLINIGSLTSLTHLYLQRNKIKAISGLETLTKLQKLYLGYNEISVVEGLEHQSALQLLHIERQSLEPGAALYFDPRTLNTLRTCLQDLDISHNHISSILDLQSLTALKQINLRDNQLTNLEELCSTLQRWTEVVSVQLTNNPVCKLANYRNQVLVASSYTLKSLDDKSVSPITKVFLQKFEQEKSKRRASSGAVSSDEFSSEVQQLVKHLPEGLVRAVSGKVLEDTISGGPHHPVPITFPLNNFVQPSATGTGKSDIKYGLRGSKPRSKFTKPKNPSVEHPPDMTQPGDEALGISSNHRIED